MRSTAFYCLLRCLAFLASSASRIDVRCRHSWWHVVDGFEKRVSRGAPCGRSHRRLPSKESTALPRITSTPTVSSSHRGSSTITHTLPQRFISSRSLRTSCARASRRFSRRCTAATSRGRSTRTPQHWTSRLTWVSSLAIRGSGHACWASRIEHPTPRSWITCAPWLIRQCGKGRSGCRPGCSTSLLLRQDGELIELAKVATAIVDLRHAHADEHQVCCGRSPKHPHRVVRRRSRYRSTITRRSQGAVGVSARSLAMIDSAMQPVSCEA